MKELLKKQKYFYLGVDKKFWLKIKINIYLAWLIPSYNNIVPFYTDYDEAIGLKYIV